MEGIEPTTATRFSAQHYEPIFPWFGGKSMVADIVWRAFGADVPNYVEPFFGSGRVLFARPGDQYNIETVNDKDGFVCNAWRAIRHAPDEVAYWVDWPVNENDLHARHAWLKPRRAELARRLEGDPEYFDAKIAGWWVWGICNSIAGAFCADGRSGPWHIQDGMLVRDTDTAEGANRDDEYISRSRIHLTSAVGISRRLPYMTADQGIRRHIPHLSTGWMGVHRQSVPDAEATGIARSLPSMEPGRGVRRPTAQATVPEEHSCDFCSSGRCGIVAWMRAIAHRLRRVRVACGDWTRILGHSPTTYHGITAVFLDPPYSAEDRAPVYGQEDFSVAHDVREWCIENGDNPMLRIALCGYEGEGHDLLVAKGWREYAWKAHGGYSVQNPENMNKHRERIWFSPACLPIDGPTTLSLFDDLE